MQSIQRLSDSELLLASRATPEAFAIFYDRHFAAVLAFFRRRVSGPEQAFDLAAETFAAALGALPRYKPGPEPARAWLFGIARHKLREAIRSAQVDDRARRVLAMQPIALDDEAIEVLERLVTAPVLELLEALPVDQRQAIDARHIEQREYSDIAAELRCSESVVRQRVSRGLAALRAQVSGRRSDD
jgi:RNA polymerase sigma factor (sigma-70 family)